MKKIVCMLLGLALVFSLVSAALAFTMSVDYEDGKLTITTDAKAYYEIYLDGKRSGAISNGTVREIEVALESGEHKVMLYNPDTAEAKTVTLMVEDAPAEEPAPAETEKPAPKPAEESASAVKIAQARFEKGNLVIRVSGLKKPAEILVDGQKVGAAIEEDGEYMLPVAVTAGKHTVTVNKTAKKEFEAAEEDVIEPLGEIVKDAAGKTVPYAAAVDLKDEKIFKIAADTSGEELTSEISLFLNGELIEKLLEGGYEKVCFINGTAALLIDLKTVETLFPADAEVKNYVFSTDPADEKSVAVNVEAEIADQREPAAELKGIALVNGEELVEVTANGVVELRKD